MPELGELFGRHGVQVRDHQVDAVELVGKCRVRLDLVACGLQGGTHPAGEHQVLHQRGYPGHATEMSTASRVMRQSI